MTGLCAGYDTLLDRSDQKIRIGNFALGNLPRMYQKQRNYHYTLLNVSTLKTAHEKKGWNCIEWISYNINIETKRGIFEGINFRSICLVAFVYVLEF